MATALITGGTGDIGSAICIELASKGYDIAVHYHKNSTRAEILCHSLQHDYGVTAHPYYADLSVVSDVSSMFDLINKDFQHIHILVNNAGISQQILFTMITEEDWDRMIDTNLKSAFMCTKLALPNMINAKSGIIINISSMWGQIGGSCEVHYSAAKAGLIGMTKALAKEVGPSGIRVNSISPGVIDTRMNSHLSSSELAELADETPLCTLGSTSDIAETVSFLVSDGARFITGQDIGVNGGYVI